MRGFMERLTRRKVVDFGHSELRRVLGILDLTMLGVGSTIGVGIYVLAGNVSRNTSGPAVTVAFLIAAVASLFAGLCYAEFGARVPKAGSAYIYTYVCIGEFVAFIIGWNLILEYVIGTASVARGFSQYVDALANNSIEDALYEAMPLVSEENYYSSFLSPYPDFLSFGLAVALSVTLALGVKESSSVNNIFTGINIIVIVSVIIGAGTQADPDNWNLSAEQVDETCPNNTEAGKSQDWGIGGFAPYGFDGIMEGAATCFYGFVGFDVIATTGEEALNPSRTVPISIGLSLSIIFLAYFGVSAVITLAIPYCLQDEDAALVVLFDEDHINWPVFKWYVSIGALFGFSASLFGAMFPLPRVIYAMASDGLVFRSLSSISSRFRTPTYATAIAGLFAGGMAMLFNLDALVNMMSIGTLMAYTIVAICVMLLRYTADEEEDEEADRVKSPASSGLSSHRASDYWRQLFNTKGLTEPTDLTASLVTYAIICFCVLMLLFDVLLVTLLSQLAKGDGGAIAVIVIFGVLNILNLVVIARQPESKKNLSFKVPLVPWLPAISTFINLYLMCNLEVDTWIRFGVWMAIGFLDYFGYGLWHSSLRKGSSSKHALDNLSYSDDEHKNHHLVIPTIEIQPATPLSSEPNTPSAKPKGGKNPLPPSPLATEEKQVSQSCTVDPKGSKTSGLDLDDIIDLDAADVAVSLETHRELTFSLTGNTSERKSVDSGSEHKREDMEGKEMVEKRDENFSNDGKEEELLRGSGSHGEGNILLNCVITGVSEVSDDRKTENKKPDEDEKAYSHTEDKKEEGSNAEEGSISGDEQSKPLPLDLSPNQDSKEASGIPRAFYSSPELSSPPSPPPSPPPSSPTSPPSKNASSSSSYPSPGLVRSASEKAHNRSVPTTPVGKRHPHKVLRRMSSFDDIPPSSPDSPFAKHVASFVVIPVQELGLDSSESSIPASPSTTQSSLSQDNLFKAVDVLNRYKKDEAKKMFRVGSADSLDSLSSDPGDAVDFLSPRRGVSWELDPIRERGESKISANGGDKIEIHPSPENANKENAADASSLEKRGTQDLEQNK